MNKPKREIRSNLVLGVLAGHVGAKNGIHVAPLLAKCTGNQERDPFGERLVRYAIEELRKEGFHICGTPTAGYFLAANDDELERTCAFLYARAMTSLTQIARMRKVALPDLRGQLKLKT